ncbi:hypothetical protein V8E53_008085, partial [Lactarius tabidus]
MEQWIHHQNRFLHILLETEGKPTFNKCSICRSHTTIKCPDYFGSPSYCVVCVPDAHRHSPFHRPLLWTSTHYTQVPEALDAFGLPTPRETPQPEEPPLEPVVSDTHFSRVDHDSDDSSSGRTRTATLGNPVFTVVDWYGVFDMEILLCVCPDGGDTCTQLLQSGLFPATFKQIETLFTVSVLEDFLTDNLECKTTVQQYYSKLQIITNKMFPNNVPVCLSSI